MPLNPSLRRHRSRLNSRLSYLALAGSNFRTRTTLNFKLRRKQQKTSPPSFSRISSKSQVITKKESVKSNDHLRLDVGDMTNKITGNKIVYVLILTFVSSGTLIDCFKEIFFIRVSLNFFCIK